MSEPTTAPPQPPQEPPTAPPTAPPPAGESSNRTVMLVLAYLGPLALIPLLFEKQDDELQWHAKHGLLLFGVVFLLGVVSSVISAVIPILGCLVAIFILFLSMVLFVVDIICMIKAIGGERFMVPGLSSIVDNF